ncbi:DNA-binding protein [Pseudoduganella sp. HUAS MS19]
MVLTAQQVIESFKSEGRSIASWARENGFNPVLVYQVLRSRNLPVRGQCHEIAMALRMKEKKAIPGAEFITQKCWRRLNFDPPCRLNFDPGRDAALGAGVCG